MPMAYVHMVQLMVDTLLAYTAFALYTKMGVFCVVMTGVITIFYSGLLELSKSFLDPARSSLQLAPCTLHI